MIPKETCEKLKEQGAKYWDRGLNPLIFDCSCEVQNCWAKKLINRNLPGIQKGWFPKRLDDVSLTGNPIVYFVQHLCDIAHPSVDINRTANIMTTLSQINSKRIDAKLKPHQFLVLTKYPERLYHKNVMMWFDDYGYFKDGIYIGTSVTGKDFKRDYGRLESLMQFEGFQKWASAEPLLGSIDFADFASRIDQVIIGAETGQGSHPCDLNWIHSIMGQCSIYSDPFVKQVDANGNRELDGQTHNTLIWRKT